MLANVAVPPVVRSVALVAVLLAAACSSAAEQDATDGAAPTPDEAGEAETETEAGETDTAPEEAGSATVGAASSCVPTATGEVSFTTSAGGTPVPVDAFVPVPDGELLAVVFNFHGLTSNGEEQKTFSGYDELAAAEGFIAVHPTGPDLAGGDAGFTGWELAGFDLPNRDDIAAVIEMMDRLEADYCADPNRMYSTGISNGSFLTSRLICETDRLAAAVGVAAVYHPDDCEPARALPYQAYHGTADTVVPFDRGDSVLGESPLWENSMLGEFTEFASDFGCEVEPTITETGSIVRHEFTGCTDDVPVTFFAIVDGGHTWPSGYVIEGQVAVIGTVASEVNATVDGWEFMSRFSR